MSIECHCTTNCNITTNICATTYYSLCVVNLLLVAQNGLSRNWLIEPIEQRLFRENSNRGMLGHNNTTNVQTKPFYQSFRGSSSCQFTKTVSGTTLNVYVDSSSCLCDDSWIKAEMVDLGCGLGNMTLLHPQLSLDDNAGVVVSDANVGTCLNFQSLR